MSYQVSKEAEADLKNIGRYTQSKWGREQRRRYLASLHDTFISLAEQPLVNRERSEFTPPVRFHQHQRHLIIYSITGQGILIIRVLHESMDIARRLVGDVVKR